MRVLSRPKKSMRDVAKLIAAASGAVVVVRRAAAKLITAPSAAVALRQGTSLMGTCIRCGGEVFKQELICPECLDDDDPDQTDQPAAGGAAP
jgi:hypothetical protein